MRSLSRAAMVGAAILAMLLSIAMAMALTDFTPSNNIDMKSRNITNVSMICFGANCATSWTSAGGNSSFNQTLTDSLYLGKTDQRYNDTTFCSALVSSVGNWSADQSNYLTATQSNAKFLVNMTCSAGYALQNATTAGAQCVALASGPAGNNGTNGLNGTGIQAATLLSNGSLNITFTNGTQYISSNITGQPGSAGSAGAAGTNGTNGLNGTGLTRVYLLANGSLNITYSNGTQTFSNNITGQPGSAGSNGAAGSNGTGIQAIYVLTNGSLQINLTNQTNITTGNLTGLRGATGADGANGVNGTLNNTDVIFRTANITTLNVGTINITVGGDNTSWNEALADTLYYPLGTNTLGYYNSSNGVLDNQSWNETKADMDYYPRNTNPQSFYNSTTFTNYYPLLTNPSGYYNSSTIPAYALTTYVNTLGNFSGNTTTWQSCGTGNVSKWNGSAMSCVVDQTGGGGFTNGSDITVNLLNVTSNVSVGGSINLIAGGGIIGSGYGSISGNATAGTLPYMTTATNIAASIISQNSTPTDKVLNGGNYVIINGGLIVNGVIQENGGVETVSTTTYGCPFMVTQATTMCYPNYLGAAISSGTLTNRVGSELHPGSIFFNSTASANTGYQFATSVNAFRLNGSEEFRTSMNLSGLELNTNVSRIRVGFLDVLTTATEVDGVYFDIYKNASAIVVAGFTMNNSVQNSTTNFTLSANTWYNFDLRVNADASNVTYTIYNDAGTLVWNATLVRTATTGVPVIAGRETGAGIVVFRTTAGGAANSGIAQIDYMVAEIRAPRRIYG